VINLKITKPTLLLNEKQVRKNIQDLVNKAKNSNVRFRPHFKTHQSISIGRWFREYGVTAITVSSLDMAQYFSKDGWNDIILAVPVNITQLSLINELASNVRLGILVESTESAKHIIEQINTSLDIWIEIDQGYHRTGVTDFNKIMEIMKILTKNDNLNIRGLLTHAGHTYKTKSIEEIRNIHTSSVADLIKQQRGLKKLGFDLELSIGDTPSCALIEKFDAIDEIRPGSFVFFDLTHVKLGVTEEESVAICVACPVIAKYPERNEIVIYGGAIHLSKEFLLTPTGDQFYGKVALFYGEKWNESIPEVVVSSISQEHGIIRGPSSTIDSISIGDILVILPIHSCLTANLFSSYLTLEGKTIGKFSW
jgi:D-serine deaminase-like pyridoxal phosphate-dependent protein